MAKLDKNTFCFRHDICIGKYTNPAYVIDKIQKKLNDILYTKVSHKNETFIVKNVSVTSGELAHISIVFTLKRDDELKNLTDIIHDAYDIISEVYANE